MYDCELSLLIKQLKFSSRFAVTYVYIKFYLLTLFSSLVSSLLSSPVKYAHHSSGGPRESGEIIPDNSPRFSRLSPRLCARFNRRVQRQALGRRVRAKETGQFCVRAVRDDSLSVAAAV